MEALLLFSAFAGAGDAAPSFDAFPPAVVLPDDPNQPAPAGYQWQKVGDGPWKLVKTDAPGVASPKTFRNGDHWGSHDCPQCGRQQLRISGSAGNGQHYHTCPVDGTTWRH